SRCAGSHGAGAARRGAADIAEPVRRLVGTAGEAGLGGDAAGRGAAVRVFAGDAALALRPLRSVAGAPCPAVTLAHRRRLEWPLRPERVAPAAAYSAARVNTRPVRFSCSLRDYIQPRSAMDNGSPSPTIK